MSAHDGLDRTISVLENRLTAALSRIDALEKELSKTPTDSSSSSSSSGSSSSTSVQEYEDLINQYIKTYVELSSKMGSTEVADQASLVLHAVNAQKEMLQAASSCKKPSDNVIANLLKPTSEHMEKITKIRDSNRASKFFNQLSTVSEGIGALSWVVVAPTPGPHVGEMRGASEFYSNKLLREFKGKDQLQVDWITAFNNFLKELQVYIKKNHTTGLEWNRNGGDASSFSSSSSSSSGSAPPPPPGPPPPPPVLDTSSSSKGPDMSNLFAELSKGTEVTSGLRKVTADMKSKNMKNKSSVVHADALKPQKESTAAKGSKEVTKPPKLALEGNKWAVEYQVGNKSIVISETEPKHTCYIYKCKDSVIQIKGKVNTITVDDCIKTAIVFENAIASFDIVNCRSVEVQVLGKVPCFAIDKTSGCQLYLSKESLGSEIVSSKSSEMNVLLPGNTANDDPVEVPIPEQFITLVKDGKLVTECSSHV